MEIYRIRDWNIHFENNRTRELKNLDWVPIPNSMDGDGYTELVDHPDGAAHFGAWVALLEVASKCLPRGTLIRKSRTVMRDGADGSQEGATWCQTPQKPHNCASLSRMTRLSEKMFSDAIPRLIDIGWIELLNVSDKDVMEMSRDGDVDDGTVPHPPAEKRLWKGREGKGIEGKGNNTAPTAKTEPPGFANFWREWPSHPRKKGRSKCLRIWESRGLESMSPRIARALECFKASRDWTKDGGQFMPGPEPWLNDESWEVPLSSLAPEGEDDDCGATPEMIEATRDILALPPTYDPILERQRAREAAAAKNGEAK